MNNQHDYFKLFGLNPMLKITKLVSMTLLGTALSACSTLQLLEHINPLSNKDAQSQQLCTKDSDSVDACQNMLTQNEVVEPHPSLFSTALHFSRLGEYTEQMATDLQNTIRGMQVDQPIVVASFVHLDSSLDSSLQSTNALGIQLAESFINELQQIGLPVIDYKLMGVLDINEKGTFAFSRDTGQFYNKVNISYVLTGTMLKNNKGIIVNARLINFATNKVIASTSKFLPNVIVKDLL
jgi:TolB-like protein